MVYFVWAESDRTPSSSLGRIIVFIRLCAMVGFLQFRVSTPTDTGYWLWLLSIICELWYVCNHALVNTEHVINGYSAISSRFALSWILDTIPKLTPVRRETYKDRLKAV